MRILYIGSVDFSLRVLEKLVQMNATVVGVCTLQKSTFNSDHVDLSDFARNAGLDVRYTPNINSTESIEWIKSLKPDVIFCFGWSRLLKAPILKLPPLGVIGYHPASLPQNRGRHPIIWALALGLNETASTFFFMDEGADTGDIISQSKISIQPTDDAKSLYEKLTQISLLQVESFLPQLTSGSVCRQVQNEMGSPNTWRKRGKKDGKIDWRMSASSIHNLVRALTKPYVGAHFEFEDKEFKVWRTEIMPAVCQVNIEPGKVMAIKDGTITVKAGEGAIRLVEFELPINLKVDDYL